MSKELDEFYKKYSARIIAMDDTPLVKVMDGGKFKLLSIEEYERMITKIADLEAKLAESESKHILDEKEWQDYCAYKQIESQIKGCLDRERELKQQLAEKEKEIESLRENSLSKRIFKEKLIPSHCMEQYEKYEQQIDKLTQDKISFAVEQLEKVKDWANDYYGEYSASVITNYIDNQIKQLKGENR